jgi:outer membrane receptor for Fe3+-dicitrate
VEGEVGVERKRGREGTTALQEVEARHWNRHVRKSSANECKKAEKIVNISEARKEGRRINGRRCGCNSGKPRAFP